MGPETFALAIPILALLIPIVAILTVHQQKMARIIHEARANANTPEIESLKSDIRELKQLLHEQSIALDNLAALPSRKAGSAEQVREVSS